MSQRIETTDPRPNNFFINNFSNNNFKFCKLTNSFFCNTIFNKEIGGASEAANGAGLLSGCGRSTSVSAAFEVGSRQALRDGGILKFVYTNETSLNNKIPELTARLKTSSKPEVVMVTETWFNTCSTPFIGGYNLYQTDREKIAMVV